MLISHVKRNTKTHKGKKIVSVQPIASDAKLMIYR